MTVNGSWSVTGFLKGLARGLVRRTQIGHFENEVTGSLYRPLNAPDDPAAFVFREARASDVRGADGLPLPPPVLRMGYAADDEEYIRSGRASAEALRGLLADHSVALEPGSAILDWGCTTGRVLRHFGNEAVAGQVWGCDIDAPSIEWARDNLSPPFRFFTGTYLPHLPFADGSFRFIYGLSVFTHIEHLADAWLLEMHRLLEPGGCAIFSIHDEHTVAALRQGQRPPWMPTDLSWDAILGHEATVVRGDRWNRIYTFFRTDYVRRVWGQYFEVAEIRPESEGYQAAVVMRKALV